MCRPPSLSLFFDLISFAKIGNVKKFIRIEVLMVFSFHTHTHTHMHTRMKTCTGKKGNKFTCLYA